MTRRRLIWAFLILLVGVEVVVLVLTGWSMQARSVLVSIIVVAVLAARTARDD